MCVSYAKTFENVIEGVLCGETGWWLRDMFPLLVEIPG